MARIVVAGASDCPYYGKVELLADELQRNLPNFFVNKIVKTREEWKVWIKETAKENQWDVEKSPIIWRELVDSGGKSYLIGGPNEFQEYVRCYYNKTVNFTTDHLQQVALNNVRYKDEEDAEMKQLKAMSNPTKIVLFGASNKAVPYLLLTLGQGNLLGQNVELAIVLVDESDEMDNLKGLQMETVDMAYPLIRSISITEDIEAAFADSNLVIVFESKVINKVIRDHNDDEDRGAWLSTVKDHYENIGSTIEAYCSSDVRVLLVPESVQSPISLQLTAVHQKLNRIPLFSVTAMAVQLEQHIRSVLADKIEGNSANITDILVWGNISGKRHIDIHRVQVSNYENGSIVGPVSFKRPITKLLWDKLWLKNNELEKEVESREKRLLSDDSSNPSLRNIGGISMGNAVSEMVRLWMMGDKKGNIHSLIVASGGVYELPANLVFCLPVRMGTPGYWRVVEDINLTEEHAKIIMECAEDVMKTIELVYPEIYKTTKETDNEEKFMEHQLRSLLDELRPKVDVNITWNLLKSSVTYDELLDISKSKELLIKVLEDMSKSSVKEKPDEITPDSLEKENTDQIKTKDSEMNNGENNAENENENVNEENEETAKEIENVE